MRKKVIAYVLAFLLLLSIVPQSYVVTTAATRDPRRIYVSGQHFMVGNDQRIWINGVNTPWFGWNDFGSDRYNAAQWDNHFAELKQEGVNATRIWINCNNGQGAVIITSNGTVTGVSAKHWQDLDSLFSLAEKHEIYIMATITSFDFFKANPDHPQSAANSWRLMLQSAATIDSFVNNYTIPFVERYGDNPFLWSIDLMNEPDWVHENEECGQLPWNHLTHFFARNAAAIRRNSDVLVTVGMAFAKYQLGSGTDNVISDVSMQAQFNDPYAVVDFWSPHYYDWVGEWFGHPFTRTPSGSLSSGGWGLCPSRPALIGETKGDGTHAWSGNSSPLTSQENVRYSITDDYTNAFANGWQGVMAWTSNGSCGQYPHIDMRTIGAATRTIRDTHPSLVFPAIDVPIPTTSPTTPPSTAVIYNMQTDSDWGSILSSTAHPLFRGTGASGDANRVNGPPRALEVPVRSGTSQGLRVRAAALLNMIDSSATGIQIEYTGFVSQGSSSSQIRLERVTPTVAWTEPTSGANNSFSHTVTITREQLQATIAASDNGDITLGATPGTAGLTITGVVISQVGGTNPLPTATPSDTTISPNLRAADIVSQISIGWNLGNTLDAYDLDNPGTPSDMNNLPATETQWLGGTQNRTTQTLIDSVRGAGFNIIRIPVSWHKAVTDAPSFASRQYTIDPRWMEYVTNIVDMAYNSGAYVILNTHHDEYIMRTGTSNNAAGLADREAGNVAVAALWAQIAEHFRDYGERLIFEGLNEPRTRASWPSGNWDWSGTSFARESINQFNQTFVNTVRASGGNNRYRLLMMPTYAASASRDNLNAFTLPTDPISGNGTSKFIMSVHTYSPHDWAHDGTGANTNSSTYSQTHINLMRSDIGRVADRAAELGIPAILGEFGTRGDRHFLADRIAHARDFVRIAAEMETRTQNPAVLRAIIWDDHGWFRLINRRAPHVSNDARQIIDAMLEGRGPVATPRPTATPAPTPTATPAPTPTATPAPTPTATPAPTPTATPAPTPTTPVPTLPPGDTIMKTSRSVDYVKNMGMGWNLGNSLDATGGSNISNWETQWGNPIVTRELIQSIAAKGFSHIRVPFTVGTGNRFSDRGASTPSNELRYVINEDWLNRYREVVTWAHDAGLYVIVNIHHDSWMWIGRSADNWRGDPDAWQVRRFRDHWTQLAQTFADFDDRVIFETLNEPHFYPDNDASLPQQNEMLALLNRAAYDIIRATQGNENRMISIPTIWTRYSSSHSAPVRDFIASLNDENVIATVHYYSEWLFSANLGITNFDEPIGSSPSARVAADNFYATLDNYFLSERIGVNVGEWGLLAYDDGANELQTGEELKYYEYMTHLARKNGVSLSFWDNGSGIDRRAEGFPWRNPRIGEILEAKERSSYSAGLDTLYFKVGEPVTESPQITLILNGNDFTGIRGLTEGAEYTYMTGATASPDGGTEYFGVITLNAEYVNSLLSSFWGVGVFATLELEFSGGAVWEQYLVRYALPIFTPGAPAFGTRGNGINIPVDFRGSDLRRVSASQNGNRVGGDHSSWWTYLQRGSAFSVNNARDHFNVHSGFFNSSVASGEVKLDLEFFDGQVVELTLNSDGTNSNSQVSIVSVSPTPPPIQELYVSFNANGGSMFVNGHLTGGSHSVLVEEFPAVVPFPTVSHANHRFVGWFTEATTGGTRYLAGEPIPSSTTLYARWTVTPTNFVLGDADGDGRLTSADSTVIARRLINPLSELDELSADLNNDSEITIADVTMLAQWLIRGRPPAPQSNFYHTPSPDAIIGDGRIILNLDR